MKNARCVDVGGAERLSQDGRFPVELAGRRVLVIRSEGEYYACAATCTHEPTQLDDGAVMLGTIECPLHGAVFDLRTGVPEFGPAEDPLPVFPCRVDAGRIIVELQESEHAE